LKKKAAGILAGLTLLAIPASSLGGDAQPSAATYAGGKGQLVAKDRAKRRPAAAVARVTLKGNEIGRVSYSISSRPDHLPVDWGFTTRCVKGALIDYFPGPGEFKTTTKNTAIKGTYRIPLADPDYCTFAVAGQIARNNLGKRVIVKIFNKQ